MSGPPRLQVQAGDAFLSRANVLRVMEPAQGAQLRILAPAWLQQKTLALGSVGPEARAAQAPRVQTGPSGSRGGSRRSPRARLWSLGGWAPPAACPNPRPGRGAAAGRPRGRGESQEPKGSALWVLRPQAQGTHRIPLRAPPFVGKGGHQDVAARVKY